MIRRTLPRAAATLAAVLAIAAPVLSQTLPGTFNYSWIGNSFMNQNAKAWVPDEVRDLCVASNGTVFTAGYSESGGSGLAIKNGAFFGRYSGFNSGFGDPVKAVATDGTNVYWGGGNGVQRYGFTSSGSPNRTILGGSSITGLAYKAGELYISDYSKNLIRVYNTKSMTQSRQWDCTRPGKLAVDDNHHVWVIQYAPGSNPDTIITGTQILSFSDMGTAGPSITDVTNPLAIAVNDANQLLVGGLDEASQIRIYGDLDGTPSLAGAFGANGGIFSGTPGLHGPLKFHQIRGLGVDGAGNIYVCMMYGAKSWGQSVEAYTSSGELLWEVHGFDYVECAAIDPDSETDAYDHQHHFTLDYAKSDGKEWAFKGFTVNRFKYPKDPRVIFDGGFRAGVGAFRVSGKLFIAESDQGGYPLNIYRFNPAVDGEVAIASVSFSGGNPDRISRDANGNGRFDAGEIANGAPGYYQYHDITPNGGICRIGNAAGPATITYYPCQGLDSEGNPIYSAATSKTWSHPPEFSCIRKVVYDTTYNIMYVGGQAGGTVEDAVVRLCRYNNWTGARTKAWDVTIPYDDQRYTPDTNYGAGRAYSVRQVGQYVFIQYGYGYIRVHDKDTGDYLGTIKPSLHGFNGGGGQVAITHGMTAYERANGEYVLLNEDAGHNHVVMTRWCPNGACVAPAAAAIIQPPASLSVFAGQPATFQVQVTGSAPIAYQWQRDSTDLPGATSATYTLPAATPMDHLATFRVKVSNALLPDGIYSDVAALTVLPEDGHKVSASFSESGSTVNLGNLAGSGLYASPDGYPAPSIRVPVGPFAPSGNIASLDFGSAASDVGGRALDFTNDFGNTLGVMTGFTLCGWLNCSRLGDRSGGNRIAFALTSPGEFGFDLAQQPDGALRLGVNEAAALGPASSALITEDPNIAATNWVFFAVTYDGTQPANNLVYYFGSPTRAVAADTTHSYARGVITASGQLTLGNYSKGFTVRVSTGANSSAFCGLIDEIHVFNRVLSLTEIENLENAPAYQPAVLVVPSIMQEPQSQAVLAGRSASFSVTGAGGLPLSCQWWRRHAGVDSAIPAATNRTYTLSDTTASDDGDLFWAVVANAAGSATGQRVLLTVLTRGSSKVWLSFPEGSGNLTANLGSLAGMGTFVRNGSFPVFSTQVPAGPFAPAGNSSSVDFGTIGAGNGGRAIDFTNAFGNTLGAMNAFTLMGWLNCRDLTTGSGGNRILFALASPGGLGFDLVQNSDGSLQIGVNEWPDGTPAISSPGKITASASAGSGNWVFFAVTYDGTKSDANTTFYFGSPTQAAAIDTTATYIRGVIATTGSLTVGNFNVLGGSARGDTGPAGSRNFRGVLDELVVFDRELTLAEIQTLQTAPAAVAGDVSR